MQTVRMEKEYTCGQLRATDAGKEVMLMGWVNRRRDHGGLIFIDLRDRDGLTQVVFNPSEAPEAHCVASEARSEYVLAVQGRVELRPAGTENPRMKTGEIEVLAQFAEILNPSKTPPFYVSEPSDVDESVRLRYRYLDLRRPRMQQNIILRHRIIKYIRDFLDAQGFLEIETPMLIKSTPEGARDYLVPSRLSPGKFYALPQSPQQLKQLLMVAGFEKYFQIARCFRDEDLRADRQPEFTQLDLEMSFVDQEDILVLMEELFTDLAEELSGKVVLTKPFPRLSFAEAMERYGSDKPDLRFEMPLVDVSPLVAESGFKVFSSTVAAGGQVKGIRVPGSAGFTRKQLDDLTAFVRQFGAAGLVSIAVDNPGKGLEGLRSAIGKFLTDEEARAILRSLGAVAGDLLLFVAAKPKIVADALGRLRLEMGRQLGLIREDVLAFSWILDPPLFEWDEEAHRFDSAHHPFTSPRDSDIPLLDTDPGAARAKAYDLVANGYELGSGSIRIHRRELQEKIFAVLGYGPEETEERFGHLLTAFEYGAPPHGGIAIGLDRVAMIWAGEDTIRDVIAFPKTQSAVDLMLGSPSDVPESQLRDLHLKVTE